MDALTFLHGHVPLFAGVPESSLRELAVASSLESFKPGQVVLFQGSSVEALHIVITGAVVVQSKSAGKTSAKVAELGPGDVFGEASIVASALAGAAVKAGEAGAVILIIPQEAFRGLLSSDAAFAARVRSLIDSRKAPPSQAS